jgi:hypothetical protein
MTRKIESVGFSWDGSQQDNIETVQESGRAVSSWLHATEEFRHGSRLLDYASNWGLDELVAEKQTP